jgi:hypothetical protein
LRDCALRAVLRWNWRRVRVIRAPEDRMEVRAECALPGRRRIGWRIAVFRRFSVFILRYRVLLVICVISAFLEQGMHACGERCSSGRLAKYALPGRRRTGRTFADNYPRTGDRQKAPIAALLPGGQSRKSPPSQTTNQRATSQRPITKKPARPAAQSPRYFPAPNHRATPQPPINEFTAKKENPRVY